MSTPQPKKTTARKAAPKSPAGSRRKRSSTAAKRPRTTAAKKASAANASEITIELESVIIIENAKELHQKLSKTLDKKPTKIILDGANIDRLDTAGLQLLTAFFTRTQQDNIHASWRNPSDNLLATSAAMDLHGPLMLEQESQDEARSISG